MIPEQGMNIPAFLLFVQTEYNVKYLINQAHRVQLTGPYSLFRITDEIALAVYFLCKCSNRVQIGENHIAVECVKDFIKLI